MKIRTPATLVTLALVVGVTVSAAPAQAQERWVTTWGTSSNWRPASPATPATPVAAPAAVPVGGLLLQTSNQTLRQIVHTSVKGDRLRVVLSNSFGTLPIAIAAAHVALRDTESSIVAGSGRPLTFGGRGSATIPAGAILVSDPVALSVPPMADLAIDLFLPADTSTWNSPLTIHRSAYTTNYVSTPGNHAGALEFPVKEKLTTWWLLSRVEVVAPAPTRAIVTFGDSITDGTNSTIDGNSRWPDVLSRRLQAQPATSSLAIVNAAIAGNRLLAEASPSFGINALARFDRDVLAQPGVAYVTVLEGINDFGMGQPNTRPSADDLIGAYQQLIARAHAHGLKIYGATLTPFEGAAYFTPEGETRRKAVNQWMRTSKAFDAVIDFDRVIRDPANPTKFLPAFDSGDHLHPNDAGYKAMGESIDLALFR